MGQDEWQDFCQKNGLGSTVLEPGTKRTWVYPDRYEPPTWHQGYNNTHLLEMDEDGVISPCAAYQAWADEQNMYFAQQGNNTRMVWKEDMASFSVVTLDC